MKTKGLIAAFVVLVLAMSTFVAQASDAEEEPAVDDQNAKWRFIIYLVADNNLDVSAGMFHVPVVESDFDELMSVGSTDEVVCYVFVDRWEGPANLFKVHLDAMEEMDDFCFNDVEANMGDPATLTSLIEFTYEDTPADHTALMFWDHGSQDIICWDDNGPELGVGDALTHHEVIEALQGYKVDIIGADECLVGQVEVAYEYATSGVEIDFLLASETYTGWRGYPYDQILRELVDNPDMTPRECAEMFIEQVDILLSETPVMSEIVNCHAAIDLAMTRTLVADFQEVASLISEDMAAYVQALSQARGTSTFQYGAGEAGLVDLRNFVETLMRLSKSSEVKDACASVLESFDETIVAFQDTSTLEGFVHGLGLTFPQDEFQLPDYYPEYGFGSEGWIEFLNLFWTVKSPGMIA